MGEIAYPETVHQATALVAEGVPVTQETLNLIRELRLQTDQKYWYIFRELFEAAIAQLGKGHAKTT
jgi:hypothetical protein